MIVFSFDNAVVAWVIPDIALVQYMQNSCENVSAIKLCISFYLLHSGRQGTRQRWWWWWWYLQLSDIQFLSEPKVPAMLCFLFSFKIKQFFGFRSEGGLELFGFQEKIKSFIRPSKLF